MNARSDQQLDDLQDVVHRFRRTPLTAGALPSTSHALVRAFLAASPERRQRLLDVLDDRLNYGVFLDSHTANMCMDAFVKEGNYRDAAKIATHLMLQEEWDDPINRALALYSCYAYIASPGSEPWREPEPEEDPKAETEFIRVNYLRNEWNDDHFDLHEASDACGKTLAWLGRSSGQELGGRSCELLGWALWKKWDALRQCCDRLQAGDGVCADVVERVSALVSEAGDACPDAAAISARLSSLPTAAAPLLDSLRQAAQAAVAAHEAAAVSQLRATYVDWQRCRLEALELQREAEDRARRVTALEERREELRQRERLLWFFDREDQLLAEVDQQWNRPPPTKPPHVERLLRKKRPTQADYVPPSVRRSHN